MLTCGGEGRVPVVPRESPLFTLLTGTQRARRDLLIRRSSNDVQDHSESFILLLVGTLAVQVHPAWFVIVCSGGSQGGSPPHRPHMQNQFPIIGTLPFVIKMLHAADFVGPVVSGWE